MRPSYPSLSSQGGGRVSRDPDATDRERRGRACDRNSDAGITSDAASVRGSGRAERLGSARLDRPIVLADRRLSVSAFETPNRKVRAGQILVMTDEVGVDQRTADGS